MSGSDPKREFAVDVVRRLQQSGHRALWAGGCVRDVLLGRDPQDYDVATDARPDEVRRLFGHRRTLAVGASFGVMIVCGEERAGNVEVATFRTEGPYLDGRRPEHVVFSSPEDDAQRRDFTINGLFYDPVEEKVLDFIGGKQDLRAGVVRAIGDPHDRMREDKLRLLRAVRFAATLDFQLDQVTADAIREMAEEILVVSAERIAQELKRMLLDPHRRRAMRLTRDVGLLVVIVPEMTPLLGDAADRPADDAWEQTLQMLSLLSDPSFELAAAVLLHAVPAGRRPEESATAVAERVRNICRRLRLSNHETDHIGWLVEHQHDLLDSPALPLSRLKRLMAHRHIGDLLALFRVETVAANADLAPVVFCEEYLRNTPQEEINPPALLTGDDLIAHGFQPGPRFKGILESVRDAQLNGVIHTQAEALALAEQLQHSARNDKKGQA